MTVDRGATVRAWVRRFMHAWRPGAGAPSDAQSGAERPRGSSPGSSRGSAPTAAPQVGPTVDPPPSGYPGDFTGELPPIVYAPRRDELPDPGEVVWAEVPFQEDHTRSKDRPVLVIGNDGPWLLALPLTSKDHDRDAAQEAGEGRYWIDIGAGDWDHRRRPSEAALHRIVRLSPASARRIGGQISQARFENVVAALQRHHRFPAS